MCVLVWMCVISVLLLCGMMMLIRLCVVSIVLICVWLVEGISWIVLVGSFLVRIFLIIVV